MTDLDALASAVLHRLAGGGADTERLADRLASHIVARLTAPSGVIAGAGIERVADDVASAVGRLLSRSSQGLRAEDTDASEAVAEADDETGS